MTHGIYTHLFQIVWCLAAAVVIAWACIEAWLGMTPPGLPSRPRMRP